MCFALAQAFGSRLKHRLLHLELFFWSGRDMRWLQTGSPTVVHASSSSITVLSILCSCIRCWGGLNQFTHGFAKVRPQLWFYWCQGQGLGSWVPKSTFPKDRKRHFFAGRVFCFFAFLFCLLAFLLFCLSTFFAVLFVFLIFFSSTALLSILCCSAFLVFPAETSCFFALHFSCSTLLLLLHFSVSWFFLLLLLCFLVLSASNSPLLYISAFPLLRFPAQADYIGISLALHWHCIGIRAFHMKNISK